MRRFPLPIALFLCFLSANVARAGNVAQPDYFTAINRMLTELGPQSARAAAEIRETFRPYMPALELETFADIEEGLVTGGLVPLPNDAERFNIRVRREGTSPIGEKDVSHQESYVSARAAAIGCLIDIASRVKSGPIEVTSLVRHLEYQDELRATNPNAVTEVPTHALGLAFDIAIVNTPLPTVMELRNVLRKMSDAGDLFVIAERQQLVFHVVPNPSHFGWYAEIYARAISGGPWDPPVDNNRALTPTVSVSIGSLQPVPAWADEWWAAENVPLEAALSTSVTPEEIQVADSEAGGVTGFVALVGEFFSSTWQWMNESKNLLSSI